MQHSKIQRLAAAAGDTVRVYWPMWLALTLMLSSLPLIAAVQSGTLCKMLTLLTFCCSAAYSWPLVLAAALAGSPRATRLIASTVALWSLACGLFPILSGQMMTDGTIVMVIETDSREAASFVSKYITGWRIAGVAAYLVFLGACIYAAGRRVRLSRRVTAAAAVAAAIVTATGTCRIIRLYVGLMCGPQPSTELWLAKADPLTHLANISSVFDGDVVTATVATAYRLHQISANLSRWEETQRGALRQTYGRAGSADSINVVVIIGESFIKRHSNLYGYRLNTNPKLSAMADSGLLTPFTDYITVGNYTNDAIRNVYNLNSVGEGERWQDAVAFPLVAARSGWRVHLYDNQVDGVNHLFDVELAGMLLNPLMKRDVYEWTTDSIDRYDGDFVARVNRRFPFDGSVGNMDIYHLYGQHFEPSERYPAGQGYDVWTADSIAVDKPWLKDEWRRRTIAEYDNATRYNDAVVAAIIDRYRGTPTVFVYFSDHGEEIYDLAATDERIIIPDEKYLPDWLRTEFEIPLFIAFTPEYATLRPTSVLAITTSASRPGSSDNIGHTILGLGGATANPHYRATRDILSPQYRTPPRLTTGSLNYDTVVRAGME